MSFDGISNDTIRANVRVHSVYQQSVLNREGGTDEVWMIDYSPGLDAHLGRIQARVDDIRSETTAGGRRSRVNDPHSAIGMMQRRRWDAMWPAIEAAMKGQEVVVQGTALGTWPGLDQRRAEMLRQRGIRTVEEMLTMSESAMIALQSAMPDLRYYLSMGRKFLEAKEASVAAAAINERDKEIETLQMANADMGQQMADMRAMMTRILENQSARPHKEEAPVDVELEHLRAAAKAAGVERTWTKSRERLEADMAALQPA